MEIYLIEEQTEYIQINSQEHHQLLQLLLVQLQVFKELQKLEENHY
jgi:hypothetical protein